MVQHILHHIHVVLTLCDFGSGFAYLDFCGAPCCTPGAVGRYGL